MQLMFEKTTILVAVTLIGFCSAESTWMNVIRPKDNRDIFVSHGLHSENANASRAWCLERRADCWGINNCTSCKCSTQNSTFLVKMDLHNSSCVDADEVQRAAGCSYELDTTPSRPVLVLELNTTGSANLSLPSSSVNSNTSCAVITGMVDYLDRGSWMRTDVDKSAFQLQKERQTKPFYSFKWNSPSQHGGRILRVGIRCSDRQSCVVFKVKGAHHYYTNVRPSISHTSLLPSPSTRYWTNSAASPVSTRSLSTSISTSVTPNVSALLQPIESSRSLPVAATSSAAFIPFEPTKHTSVKGDARCTKWFCKPLYIGLVSGGGLVLVLAILIIIHLVKRKKNPRTKPFNPDTFTEEFGNMEVDFKESKKTVEMENLIVMNSYTSEAPRKHTLRDTADEAMDIIYQNLVTKTPYQQLQTDGQDSSPPPVPPHSRSPAQKRVASTNPIPLETLIQSSNQQSTAPSTSRKERGLNKMNPRQEAIINSTGDRHDDVCYEIMEKKSLPRRAAPKNSPRNSDFRGKVNMAYKEAEDNEMMYELMGQNAHEEGNNELGEASNELFYDNVEGGIQPTYELMGTDMEGAGESETGEEIREPEYDLVAIDAEETQPCYEIMSAASHEDAAQPNYEVITDTGDVQSFDHEEQPSYEIMTPEMDSSHANYEVMVPGETGDYGPPNNAKEEFYELMNQGDAEIEHYDLPRTDGSGDVMYDVPDVSAENVEPDYHYALGTQGNHDTPSEGNAGPEEYLYADVPTAGTNKLLEKLKTRSSWHPGGEGSEFGDLPDKRANSWETQRQVPGQGGQAESDELYTIAKDTTVPKYRAGQRGGSAGQRGGSAGQRGRSAGNYGGRGSPKKNPSSPESPRNVTKQMAGKKPVSTLKVPSSPSRGKRKPRGRGGAHPLSSTQDEEYSKKRLPSLPPSEAMDDLSSPVTSYKSGEKSPSSPGKAKRQSQNILQNPDPEARRSRISQNIPPETHESDIKLGSGQSAAAAESPIYTNLAEMAMDNIPYAVHEDNHDDEGLELYENVPRARYS